MFTTTKDYLLMINSKSGRYLAPVANSEYRETDFVQGIAGKFKLIGRQELNGEYRHCRHGPRATRLTNSQAVRLPNQLVSRDLTASISKSAQVQIPEGWYIC